jgi:Tol biopolymer transport system component
LTSTNLHRDLAFLNGLGAQPWSPDSKTLLFPRKQPDGSIALWTIKPATREEAQLTSPPPGGLDWDAAWSFDGKWIAFAGSRGGKSGVRIMPATGGEPRMLVEGGESPTWAPDNSRVMFCSRRGGAYNIWEIEIQSGRLRQLTTGPGEDRWPVVSANGKLAYSYFNHTLDVYRQDFESGKEERLTFHAGLAINARVSPDGTRIAYHSNRSGNAEVWLLDLEKKTERLLTDHPAEDSHPDWSPDGRQVVFRSTRDGLPHLWAVNVDGGPPRRLTEKAISRSQIGSRPVAYAVAPRWSPDGKAIGYIEPAQGGMALWTLDPVSKVTQQRLSGDLINFDWYRDSRRVFYTRKAADRSPIMETCLRNLDTGEESVVLRGFQGELASASDGSAISYGDGASHFSQNLFALRFSIPSGNTLPRALGKARQLTDGKGIWHIHNGGWWPGGKAVVYTRDFDQGDILVIENYLSN